MSRYKLIDNEGGVIDLAKIFVITNPTRRNQYDVVINGTPIKISENLVPMEELLHCVSLYNKETKKKGSCVVPNFGYLDFSQVDFAYKEAVNKSHYILYMGGYPLTIKENVLPLEVAVSYIKSLATTKKKKQA